MLIRKDWLRAISPITFGLFISRPFLADASINENPETSCLAQVAALAESTLDEAGRDAILASVGGVVATVVKG